MVLVRANGVRETCCLQAVGLAVLMAKAGLAVPAAHPVKLPPFSRVLADIGDEQSLASSLSTFSGHLNQIQAGACRMLRTQDSGFSLGAEVLS